MPSLHVNTILWQSNMKKRHPTRSTKCQSIDQNAGTKEQMGVAVWGIINYLGKFSPGTVEVCEPLRKLTSTRVAWTWNASNQQMFNKAKSLIKAEVCMKFYDDTKPLYLETDASGVGLGAALLQLCNNTSCQKGMAPDNTNLHPIVFASKSLTGAEWGYSNIVWEALGILHYCFGREVLVIMDHITTCIYIQKICSHVITVYTAHIVKNSPVQGPDYYKPGPDIFIADWLSRHNHIEGKDKHIEDMDVQVDALQSTTDMP